jgi:hypothetical protein
MNSILYSMGGMTKKQPSERKIDRIKIATVLLRAAEESFLELVSGLGFVSGTPWWPAALAPTIAYGAAAPKPNAQAPSTHHGRRRLRLVWA